VDLAQAGKIIRNSLVFLKEEKFATMVYYTFVFKSIVMNRVAKLEFTQTKNRLLAERG